MIKGKLLEALDESNLDWVLMLNEEEPKPEKERLVVESKWQDVVNLLPTPLKETVSVLDGTDEVKMALYCTIAIAGSLMAGVEINYNGKKNYPALMTMLYYPPASGKGQLTLIPTVLKKINAELLEKNNTAIRKYNSEMAIYKKALSKRQEMELPKKPSLPLIQIPGNITSSKLIEQLAENNGKEMLLLFESEMDSFGISSKGEHGKMNSTTLRSSFHNEPVSLMRRGDSEHLVANTPKLATVFIGTSSQISKIISNNEDGLLSRFTIVEGNAPLKWKDVQPCNSCESLDEHYESLSDSYYRIWKFLSGKTINVQFTSKQWDWINEFGESRLLECAEINADYASSIAKRHANMIVRIAAVVCMVRYYNRKDTNPIVICGDDDFEIAKTMIEESYKSSINLFQQIPKDKPAFNKPDSNRQFFDDLPEQFEIKDISAICDKHEIKERNVFRRLNEFKEKGMLHSPRRGKYAKLPELPLAEVQQLTDQTIIQNG